MIRYSLTCAHGHCFDSWFQSADAFETLSARGLITCETCGSDEVQKALMTPGVALGKAKAEAEAPKDMQTEVAEQAESAPPSPTEGPGPALAPQTMAAGPLSQPGSPLERMLTKLREQVEAHSTYVGREFAQEARDMHLGDAPERQIHGEATEEEARELLEDGVPILPLPVLPKSRSN